MIKLKSLFRRGQAPSGSKQSGQLSSASSDDRLKKASSVSSVDAIGVPSPVTTTKNKSGSKNQIFAGSRDKLDENYQPRTPPRGNQHQRKPPAPAPGGGKTTKQIVEAHQLQQQNTNVTMMQNNSDAGLLAIAQYPPSVIQGLPNDLTSINFAGPIEEQRQTTTKMIELQNQLERLTHENMALEVRVAELSAYQNEVAALKIEISKLQTYQDRSNDELQRVADENDLLRSRLRDIVQSPLSDTEKQQIIQNSQRLHSSAPASIALPILQDTIDGTPCATPDWDKQSSSSEVAVACLQDKIIQMEESHLSTNEELQATLQELADLQSQLTELQQDNERLHDEKDVLFQSLCRQTEKLEDSRGQIGTLQELLLSESNQQETNGTETEQKLYDLLKNAQEERESLLIKQNELNSELNEMKHNVEEKDKEIHRLRERLILLESTVDASNAEKKQIESLLLSSREESAERQIEISRLTTLLENARAKIDEMEQDRVVGEKSDIGELLDATRKEKESLEVQIASLQEQYSKCLCEVQKLKDQLTGMAEEVKVARNNAKCALSDLEYKYDNLKQEKQKLNSDYQALQDTLTELEVQCKCHLEDKSQLELLLSETQRHVVETEKILSEKEEHLSEEMKVRKQENEEWEQFQKDLLMTVRVANDFKTEAQHAHEQLALDNKNLREKIRGLDQQIEKLNKTVSATDNHQSLLNSMKEEMSVRRQKIGSLSRQDSKLSVKSLIESIENVTKEKVKGGGGGITTSDSNSSINSLVAEKNGQNGGMMINNRENEANDWVENVISSNQILHNTTNVSTKGPLREQQISLTTNGNQKGGIVAAAEKDPLNALVINGGSKRNALLKWCQNKTVGYRNIDITNFSSSWNDGLALCAIMHSYLPDKVPYDTLGANDKRTNFSLAFAAAESVGIHTTLNINEMCQQERPDWQQVMAYVTSIYKHFET